MFVVQLHIMLHVSLRKGKRWFPALGKVAMICLNKLLHFSHVPIQNLKEFE